MCPATLTDGAVVGAQQLGQAQRLRARQAPLSECGMCEAGRAGGWGGGGEEVGRQGVSASREPVTFGAGMQVKRGVSRPSARV